MKTPDIRAPRTQTIQVPAGANGDFTDPEDPVLQDFGRDLLRVMESAPKGTIFEVLFADVTLAASCHAAVLAPVLERVVRGQLRERYLLGVDLSGRNTWDADAGLAKESKTRAVKLVCAWRGFEGGVELVGAVDEQVNSTYLFVVRRGDATARDLAQEAGLSIQAASNRFAKAAELGVLIKSGRRSVPGGGAEHVYRAVA